MSNSEVENQRKSLSKKIRFEVLKRDSFKCIYCGASAPEAVLHVDHVTPVSKGGTNDILNLRSACQPCNAGKSDRALGDHSVMSKTKDQLDELQVRHEQLEMMMEWQKGLRNLQTEVIDSLVNHWDELTYPYVTNDEERTELTKLSRKYTLLEIMNAMDISSEQYIKYDAQKDEPTEDSVLNAFKKLAGILRNRKDFEKDPELSELYYIRGILKNRFSAYPVETFSMKLMDEARKKGVSIREMRELAKTQSTWTKFKDSVEELMSEKSARVETTI